MFGLKDRIIGGVFSKFPGEFNSAFGLDGSMNDLEFPDDVGEITYAEKKPTYITRFGERIRNFGRKISDGIAYYTAWN